MTGYPTGAADVVRSTDDALHQDTSHGSVLFEIENAPGDPVRPGMHAPTPVQDVARLNRSQREARVYRLIEQAEQIVVDGVRTHLDDRRIAAICVLFSGGSDSTALTHLFRHRATHAIHCNTTIGIEETREFVRTTCTEWGLPLLEEYPPQTYAELVIARGFPGPAMHWLMYQRLKERGLRQAQRKLVGDSRRERVVFIAGRRRQESARRKHVPLYERQGSVIWVSPLANWTSLDLNTYRLISKDVPVNPVTELLHMSGECLCGSFAKPGELDEIRTWFPRAAEQIDTITAAVRTAGWPTPLTIWGHGQGQRSVTGRLCSSCESLFEVGE
ncbi:hypothetical protein IFM12275_59300 [Nocardia sputorum]|uniref:phosphoadenosine phosphosulfate reductase family protein n=1 Tax=Nocardia sputorum TaxID=2984338 RepID=UPI0024931171|nr:phosphoadenosine phosphosulfate reductase family protein [Nocardia sputorum]BDT95954.1 hypothetical protein IFM12275_59300 [Nocardia sputorum]